VVAFQKGLVGSAGKGAAQPVGVLLPSSLLLFSYVDSQGTTTVYMTPIRKKKFCRKKGKWYKKTRDAQCASAHVAMAAVDSFIAIWLPLHERTGLSVSPLARPLLVCIQISILG